MDLDKLKKQLIKHEGLRLVAYTDTTGNPTLGVGHNLHTPISIQAANQILMDDICTAMNDLSTHLPWWNRLDEVRQRVLVDMCFNLGIKGLMGFVHTLEAIKAGEYARAAELMLQSVWAKQVPTRAARLAQMMASGMDLAPQPPV